MRLLVRVAQIQLTRAPRRFLRPAPGPAPTNRSFHCSRYLRVAGAAPTSPAGVNPPPPPPPPEVETNPNKHAAFLGEADSNDAFESRKDIEGEKLEAVDATNSAFLGEADSDDGFVMNREAHPEEADHKITDTEESGLLGQPGEGDK